MPSLSRASILAVDDLPREKVEVPEWGGYVFVRTLTGSERDQFEQSLVDVRGKQRALNLTNARARLVAFACCNDEGHAVFTPGDVESLGKKSGKALERLADVAQRLSGLRDEDVEDLAKN